MCTASSDVEEDAGVQGSAWTLPAASPKPPLLSPPSCDAAVCHSSFAHSGQNAIVHRGLTAVAPEDAALAAGALAELRASVGVVVGRLDMLESEIADDASQRQGLNQAVSQHKRKHAETSKQLCSLQELCMQLSNKLDDSIAKRQEAYDDLGHKVSSLEKLCMDSKDACSDNVMRYGNANEDWKRTSVQIQDFLSEWQSKHCHVDSRILCLEQSCRDLQARAADAVDRAWVTSQHSELEMQLAGCHARLEEQCSVVRACQEVSDQHAVACRRVSQDSYEQGREVHQALAEANSAHAELSQRLAMLEKGLESLTGTTETRFEDMNAVQSQSLAELEEGSKNLIAEAETRCKNADTALSQMLTVYQDDAKRLADQVESRFLSLETFHSNLVKDPPWEQNQAASTPTGASKIVLSWDVEARLRDIAEEVYATSEQAVTTYIDAVRAELSQRVEDVAQHCLDSLPPMPNAFDCSLSCSDAFFEAADVTPAESVCRIADPEAEGLRDSWGTLRQRCVAAQKAFVSRGDTAESKQSHLSLLQCSAATPTQQPASADGGTGSCHLNAGSSLQRRCAEASLPLTAPDMRHQPTSVANPASTPIWRPAGVAANKRREPQCGGRRLRSASPVQAPPDGRAKSLLQPRVPSSPPCII
jgi:hypothetical protein